MNTAQKIEALVLGYLGAGVTETEYGKIMAFDNPGEYALEVGGDVYLVMDRNERGYQDGWSVVHRPRWKFADELLEAARLAVEHG